MAQANKKDLGYLGEDFQFKLVHEFLSDNEFFSELHDLVTPNEFTNPYLKEIVCIIKDWYSEYGLLIDYSNLKTKIRSKYTDYMLDSYLASVEKVEKCTTIGSEFNRQLAEKFFKQQAIIRTANEILKIAGDGDISQYDLCVDKLSKALHQTGKQDLGARVFDNVNETLSDDYRIVIPTGIGAIDETLEGGLGKEELGVIIGPSSFGKAQPLTARIVTPSGFKQMGDIKVGDDVIGRDGKPHKVTGVFPQGKRPIYRVTFSNGTSCECDIEHLWDVNSLYQRCGKKYIKGVSKSRDDKYYAPDLSFKTLTLKEIISKGIVKSNGRHNFKVPRNKPVEFVGQELPLDPYLVGFMYGDANFDRMTISVGVKDKETVESILSPILGEDLHMFYRENRNIWSFDVAGNTKRILKENFDTTMLSGNKVIPERYIINSKENRIALLQGLLDSDGYANKNGSCEFCSKSKALAEQVRFLVLSLGGYASFKEDKSSYVSKKTGERIDCGSRYRLTISLCDDTIKLFRFERKQSRVKYRTPKNDCVYITSAEYVRDDEAQCIMVDSDEHLYLTEDFIVTHNTSLTTAIAAYAATHGNKDERGFKVLQIVFEDRIKQICRKHFGYITGIEAKDQSKPEYVDEVKEQLEKYDKRDLLQENLRIVKLPSGEKSPQDIERLIRQLTNSGFRPDLVIIDYFECLKMVSDSTTNSEWEREGKTMRKFEAMAGELNVGIWIPLQGTKDSVNMELVTMDKAGGSFKKIQIAHIVMSIARTVDDISDNKATIAILKNRAGKAGKIFNNVEFNNGTCRISTDNVVEFESLTKYNENSDKQKLADNKLVLKRYEEAQRMHNKMSSAVDEEF